MERAPIEANVVVVSAVVEPLVEPPASAEAKPAVKRRHTPESKARIGEASKRRHAEKMRLARESEALDAERKALEERALAFTLAVKYGLVGASAPVATAAPPPLIYAPAYNPFRFV